MHNPGKIVNTRPRGERWFPNGEWVLLLVLAVELAVFGVAGERFLTFENAFEITRLVVEVGLLALAMTFVIKTGGIDLSVGSIMALTAVAFGWLWRDIGLPVGVAALLGVSVGLLCGALNGWLITAVNVPPLIVTLGSLSLFRGLAEGLTGGYTVFTGFPAAFLALGQGYLPGGIPMQLPLLLAAGVLAWLIMHRTPFGREVTAVGFSSAGARYAGIPATAHLRRIYAASGLAAGVAAIIYVAHLGQAKADAGTGYELMAITAVVLGGTSIAGGRGTVHGTLLGLACIAVLQNGLRLAGQPTELAGILIGTALIATIVVHKTWQGAASTATAEAAPAQGEDIFEMKNSQVAAIVVAILVAGFIVAGSNWLLVRSLGQPGAAPGLQPAASKRITVAMMPKTKSDSYFVSCKQGADEAAKELGINLLWDAPNEADPARQNELVEAWITKGVDVLAVSAENRDSISTVLRKARQRGIEVVTWDADAQPDARDFLVNQATQQGIGYKLADEAARVMGGTGKYAILTATLTAANQNEWIKYIRERMASKYPQMQLAVIRPSDGDRAKATTEAKNIIRAYPDVRLIMAIAAPAVPGAAEAMKQEGSSVKVIGLSLPSMCRDYVHSGHIESVVLWKTVDLGYLTVHAAKALHDGTLKRGAPRVAAGRLGELEVKGDNVLLGEPFVFTKANIDQFDF